MNVPLRRLAMVAGALVVTTLAGCSTAAPSGAPSNAASAGPVTTASAAPPQSFGPPPGPTPDDAAPLTVDPTLLDILPASIGSTPVQEDLDAAAQALSDTALDPIAVGVDAAVAVGGGNLVYALIVRLKPGAFGEELYRQWRDSYDEGACAAAGGVVGRAEAEIGGRKTYVTSCVGALRTYHLWLADQDVLISASSIGDGRFGEQLLEGLRVGA